MPVTVEEDFKTVNLRIIAHVSIPNVITHIITLMKPKHCFLA